MNCTLTIDQQKKLFKKVYSDLLEHPADKYFNFKDYANSFYKDISDKTGDNALALSYVSLLPQNITANVGNDISLTKKFHKVFSEIAEHISNFENIDFVSEFVTPEVEDIQELKEITETLKQESIDPQKQQSEDEPVIEEPDYDSTVLSFLTDKPNEKTEVDAEKEKFYNLIKKRIIIAFNNTPQGEDPYVEGVGRVRLTLMSDTRLDKKHLREGTAEFVGQGGVALVVTEYDGDIMYFDDNGQRTVPDNGKPAYYNIAKNFYDNDIKAFAKDRNMSIEDARAVTERQSSFISNLREYINQSPEKNQVIMDVKGGTFGTPVLNKKLSTPVAALNLKGKVFAPVMQDNGMTHFNLSDFNGSIQLEKPVFSVELAEKLASLLLDNIKVETPSGKRSISSAERIKLFKQFVLTSVKGIDIYPAENGTVDIKIFGSRKNLGEPTTAKNTIVDYLTKLKPTREITKEQLQGRKIIKTTEADYQSKYALNHVLEVVSPEGAPSRYFVIEPSKMNTKKDLLMSDKYDDFEINGDTLATTPKSYIEFLKNNFVVFHPIDVDGNVVSLNPQLQFIPSKGQMKKLQEHVPTPDQIIEKAITAASIKTISEVQAQNADEQLKAFKDAALKRRNKLDKILSQKTGNLKATPEQIAEAEKWYRTHPLSKIFPFTQVFTLVNRERPNSIATWEMNGITLYSGADYSDLYHEAWHGFTQGFLTRQDKAKLYNEIRKKTGTFTDYAGKKISFAKANLLQLEEYLAEDFRGYMLSGGKTVAGSVRNTIFRKIWNFLKALFGDISINEIALDNKANATIRDLYEKLRIGDLSGYTFSESNANFDILNKGIERINKDEEQSSLDHENSRLVMETVDSLFSEYSDFVNAGLTDEQKLEKAALELNSQKTPEQIVKLKELKGKQTYQFATELFSTDEGLKECYGYVQLRLSQLRNEIAEQLPSETNVNIKNDLQRRIDTIDYALRNFGNVDTLSANKDGVGVVGYHLFKSDLVKYDVIRDILEEQDNTTMEEEGKQVFDRGGNETSVYDLAKQEVRYMIAGLYETNKSGEIQYNALGVPKLAPYKKSFNRILTAVQNSSTRQKMYETLQNEAVNYPPIKQLLEKLGPPSYTGQTETEVQNWVKFWQTMNKYRISLKQMTVDEVTEDEDGEKLGTSIFEMTIGETDGDFRKIQKNWESKFQQTFNSPYIKNDARGNYLDVVGITKKYPDSKSIVGNEFEFLKDIGIVLTDDEGAHKALQSAISKKELRLNTLPDKLKELRDNGIKIRHISQIIAAYPKLNLSGEQGNYKKLAQIEAKYSGASDFMRTNAVGDAQSEFSLNTTVTQIIKKINEASSFQELMLDPTMQYLAVTMDGTPYNAFSKNSQWLNSIFDMKMLGGPKRAGVTLNVENLSGVILLKDGKSTDTGVISSSADAATKLIYDLHLQLMTGTPELVRAADKKTSISIWVSGKKLYVNTSEFFNMSGQEKAFEIIFPYIKSELDRVLRCRQLLKPNANIQNFDFNYLNRGKDFVMFEGVLSDTTKNALYDVNGNIDEYFNTEEGNVLRGKVYEEVTDYFAKQVTGVTTKFNEAKFISKTLRDSVKSEAEAFVAKADLNQSNIDSAIIKSYVYNNWIHHFEESILLFGDPAQYNMSKEEYQKRIASANSTGDLMCTDPEFISYINDKVGRPLAAAKGFAQKAYNGTLDTAVFSDVKIQSKYYDEYVNILGGKEAANKYGAKGVNVGDAQGWMSFDSYRIVGKSIGDWTDTQEKLYQQIVKNQISPDEKVMEFFPVRKMSYFGAMQGGVMPLTALHKFSLFPLIPSAIKGTNLEKLHDKMMKEGVDYALFESGSKISTITKDGKTDKISQDTPFTKNTVFADYLKNQIEVAPKFKKNITFFTQLRKLVDLGLMENGMPTDYTKGKESWDKLKEADKRKASARYKYRQAFLDDVFNLGEVKKKELLDEMGWTLDKNGKPTGDIKSLLRFVSSELERSDLGDHEREFLQIGSDGKLKHDLSLSLSADKIEKILVALVNKRLVRYKVNGEWLVQVSSAGFEKATPEQAAEYGQSDLTTYHKGPNGKTKAAKCKISLQGQFRKLLTHPDVIAHANVNNMSRFDALNTLLKDDKWLDKEDNRKMITMIGARIPTQGLNSMEFAEVCEFLPETTGNIIIMPPEITSKSGTDYDFDKLPMMMPNLQIIGGKLGVVREYKPSEIKDLYDKYKKFRVEKEKEFFSPRSTGTRGLESIRPYDDLLHSIFGYTSEALDEEMSDMLLEEGKIKTLEEFSKQFDSASKTIENNIIQHTKDMLELPENFANLIRPNDTNIVEPLAKEMAKYVEEGYTGKKGVSGNQIFEILYNLNKHQYNSVGKQIVGIGAVNNAYNPILNAIGAYLNPTYTKGNSKVEYRNEVLLKSNKLIVDGKDVISLGGLKDANNENDIAEVISQILNGGLDVAKDAWVFFLQANKEITPVLLFMVKAGVPIKDAVYLVSQPLVREYVKQQQLYSSTFASALNKTLANKNFAKRAALMEVLQNPAHEFNMPVDNKGNVTNKILQEETLNYTKSFPDSFKTETLLEGVTCKDAGKVFTNEDRAAFLHFIEIENMSKNITNITTTTNIDTTPTGNLFEAESKLNALEGLKYQNSMPESLVNGIMKNTTIGAYEVQNFTLSIFVDLFKLRNHPVLREFINEDMPMVESDEQKSIVNTIKGTFKDEADFDNAFRNDLVNYIFQNSVRAFDINTPQYKGSKVTDKIPVQEVDNLKFGAFIKDNILYVDKAQIKKDFKSQAYARTFDKEGVEIISEYQKQGLAPVGENAFKLEKEYAHFVYERESLRVLYPYSDVKDNEDYVYQLQKNLKRDDYKKEGETAEAFEKRMKRRSYEEFIRDKALDNILNPWKIFRSHNSYSDQFARIRTKYPELLQQYYLLQNLQVSEGLGYRNLRLSDSRVDKDSINLFHENLLNLANNSVVKVADPIENERISNFFAKFPIITFMQSGMNIKSAFSMTRIVPQEMFIALMEKPAKEWQDKMNTTILMDYFNKFVLNNLNRGERVRSKDYLSNATLQNPVVDKVEPEVKKEIKKEQDETKTTAEVKPISDEELQELLKQCFK